MKLAIIAGGKGTRLGLKDIPKPMVQIGGMPLLEHQINNAKQYGIKDICILSGYLSDVIEDYFKDGSDFGVNISYIIEKKPLGTAGAVKQIKGLFNERFMVFYGDVLFGVDLELFIAFDKTASSIATIIVHPNDHPYDSDLLEINNKNIVVDFHPKPHSDNSSYGNLVNAAIYILDPLIFKYIPYDIPSDFGKDIFPILIRSKETIWAYKSAEYIKDIGTINRLKEVEAEFISGKVNKFSKKNKRSAIFIDRDGTLIEEKDLLHKLEDFEIFPFSTSAIKKINNSDYLVFLVTNQPVVARNLCSISTVKEMHNKLETLLGKEKTYINDIYFCPHHPDSGYPGENKEFKIDCNCRKPKPGMINRAVKEYNVDVESSWFIGDTTTDIQTGINAGLKTALVRTGKGGKDGKFNVVPDLVFDNIEDAVDYILYSKAKYEDISKEIIKRIITSENKLPFIVSAGGVSRSGKSCFAHWLRDYLSNNGIPSAVINLDNWIIGVTQRNESMTVRERYRYREIEEDFNRLLSGEKIVLNLYDPYSRITERGKDYSLHNERCIIIIGVPVLDIAELRNKANIKLYVETEESKRRQRFFSFYKWKELPDEDVEKLYDKRMKDEFVIIEDSKKYADFIISN